MLGLHASEKVNALCITRTVMEVMRAYDDNENNWCITNGIITMFQY